MVIDIWLERFADDKATVARCEVCGRPGTHHATMRVEDAPAGVESVSFALCPLHATRQDALGELVNPPRLPRPLDEQMVDLLDAIDQDERILRVLRDAIDLERRSAKRRTEDRRQWVRDAIAALEAGNPVPVSPA